MFEFNHAISMKNLFEAWQKVSKKTSASTGIDNISIDYYKKSLEQNLYLLHYTLLNEEYFPKREKEFINHKGRKIFISCVEDKIVQTAIALVLSEMVQFQVNVQSFVKGRSIFTAYDRLRECMQDGTELFYKMDIRKFYESIPKTFLMEKVEDLISDRKFYNLIKRVVYGHDLGISTGSCLSPILTNIYMMDFDKMMVKKSKFYLRYVDDILTAPRQDNQLGSLIKEMENELNKMGLKSHSEKSKIVNTQEGFKYLGFDVKMYDKVDALIADGEMEEASRIIENNREKKENRENFVEDKPNERYLEDDKEIIPNHILAIERKCHMMKFFIEKAKKEGFLSHPEKRIILYVYSVLGEEGKKYIHSILRNCMDYNEKVTEGYIRNCNIKQPMGCKKICTTFESICNKKKCAKCNFKKEAIYPTPVIYAMREKKDCFKFEECSSIRNKNLMPKMRACEVLSKTIEINKKMTELREQKAICKTMLEDIFERNQYLELETPYGLLVKNEDGVFIKII